MMFVQLVWAVIWISISQLDLGVYNIIVECSRFITIEQLDTPYNVCVTRIIISIMRTLLHIM